jgi:hypothetical protein
VNQPERFLKTFQERLPLLNQLREPAAEVFPTPGAMPGRARFRDFENYLRATQES